MAVWESPEKETLRSTLQDMILKEVPLTKAAAERKLPVLVVLDGLLRYFPDAWHGYNLARKAMLKEKVLEALIGRLCVDMGEIVDGHGRFRGWEGLSENAKNAIESFGVDGKIKLTSRNETIKLIGKELGMFAQKVVHEGEIKLSEVLKSIDKPQE